MFAVEPLEGLLPGTWRVSFVDNNGDITGTGEYTFKLAGTFNAEVRDVYSGQATLHGYWEIQEARLVMESQEMTAWCTSCLGAGIAHRWTVELEIVGDDAFSGEAVIHNDNTTRDILFERV
jgi:hypothetical protein